MDVQSSYYNNMEKNCNKNKYDNPMHISEF